MLLALSWILLIGTGVGLAADTFDEGDKKQDDAQVIAIDELTAIGMP